jgi:hypothetical protein
MKTKVLMVAATIVTWFGFGIHAAKADETHCYTVASLKGTYATVATYGAHVAVALGVRHFDGEGNLRGPSPLTSLPRDRQLEPGRS